MLAAYDAALDALAALGAEIVDVALPCRFADATVMTGRIIGSEAYRWSASWSTMRRCRSTTAVRPRIQLGRGISARDYLAALAERDALKRRFLAALDGHRRAADPDDADRGDPRRVGRPDHDAGAFHPPRQPVGAVRAGGAGRLHRDGLPLSLQIVCRPYDEATALRIGWAYQQATDWHERHPPGLE